MVKKQEAHVPQVLGFEKVLWNGFESLFQRGELFLKTVIMGSEGIHDSQLASESIQKVFPVHAGLKPSRELEPSLDWNPRTASHLEGPHVESSRGLDL